MPSRIGHGEVEDHEIDGRLLLAAIRSSAAAPPSAVSAA